MRSEPATYRGHVAPSPTDAARRVAEQVLRPQAERADVDGVQRAVVDEVARAGLLGLAGPRGYGGSDAPARVQREVTELLAGGCLATWFVTTQHTTPVTVLARSGNVALKERHLAALCAGTALGAIALAHVRRSGPPPVTAVRVPGGWRLDGDVPWTTSWGLADLLLLAGASPDGELVQVLLPAREAPGLVAGPPLRLAAVQGTRTVTLALHDLRVGDADVADVARLDEWLEADRVKTANATPAVFGLTAEAVARLAETAVRREDPDAADLAARLGEELDDLRRTAYALVDHVPAPDQLDDRLELRAASLELAVRAATGLVAATGGSAMALDAAPQRLARQALFLLVQAQTRPVRSATLRLLRELSP